MNTFEYAEKMRLWGKKGELLIGAICEQHYKFDVWCAADYEYGRAPLFPFGSEKFICPDLVCHNGDQRFFVEVKRKEKWVKYAKGGKPKRGQHKAIVPETGFDLHSFESYTALKKANGWDIWCFFVQENAADFANNANSGVYFGELSAITPYLRSGQHRRHETGDWEPMVYFPVTCLQRLWSLEQAHALAGFGVL